MVRSRDEGDADRNLTPVDNTRYVQVFVESFMALRVPTSLGFAAFEKNDRVIPSIGMTKIGDS
ncbi:hypothetical protein GCM10027057_27150 [Marisediminicola antarctica]